MQLLLGHVSQKGLHDIWSAVDCDNNTAHHIAAKAKNPDILKVFVTDNENCGYLVISFVLKSLMEHNSSCLVEKNSNGLTPFHIAIQQGKLRLVLLCFQTLSIAKGNGLVAC